MTGPSHEPLDEQERELARILRALPGAEPPAALDQRILRAAADANAATPPRRSLRRWVAFGSAGWGIGGAAAAVLALGVGWHLLEPVRNLPMDASTPVAAPMQDDSVVVSLGEPQSDPGAQAESAKADMAAAPVPAPARPQRPAARQRQPAPGALAVEAAPVLEPAPAAPVQPASGYVSPAAPAAAANEAAASSLQAQQDARDTARSAESDAFARQAKASAERAEAFGESSRTRAGAMTPAAWIAQVRSLRDANRRADAADSLRRFHQYYPQYAIPADLLPLLRE